MGISTLDVHGFMSELTFRCLISPEYESAEEMRKNILPGQYVDLQNEISKINGFETVRPRVGLTLGEDVGYIKFMLWEDAVNIRPLWQGFETYVDKG